MSNLARKMTVENQAFVQKVAEYAGIETNDAVNVFNTLLPAISSSLKQNAANDSGLESLMGALEKGHHEKYIEQPEQAVDPQGIADGKAILGHLFNNDKNISRQLADKAANDTGVSNQAIRHMLPMIASGVMGLLSQQTQHKGLSAAKSQDGLSQLMTSLLDADKDGSISDDLIRLFGKMWSK